MRAARLNVAATALLMMILPTGSRAQTGTIEAAARAGIDAGNRAWIDGMKRGDARLIAATYAEDALDCGPTGECTQGRAAIERRLGDRCRKLGRAVSASVTSKGAVQQGDFVYEWGEAEASFAAGNRIAGRFLTVWRKETAGGWKIFRNMKIPADADR
jgi:ketosteroid isomerase-like protein